MVEHDVTKTSFSQKYLNIFSEVVVEGVKLMPGKATETFASISAIVFELSKKCERGLLTRACRHLSAFLLKVTRFIFWYLWTSITAIKRI